MPSTFQKKTLASRYLASHPHVTLPATHMLPLYNLVHWCPHACVAFTPRVSVIRGSDRDRCWLVSPTGILVDESSLYKVVKLTETIGMVYSGMGPDSRVLMSEGRKLAQKYFRV